MSVSGIQSSLGTNLALILQNMQLQSANKTGAVQAQKQPTAGGMTLDQILLKLADTNGDGKISKQERTALEEKLQAVMDAMENNAIASSSTTGTGSIDTSGGVPISSILASLGSSQSSGSLDQSTANLLASLFSNGSTNSKDDLMVVLSQSNVDVYA